MEKFTKGPWYLDEFGNILPEGAIDGFSCIRAGGLSLTANKGEPMYNRHLIAAAPEMYGELTEVVKGLECLIDNSAVNALYLPALYEQVERIEALLAKARGEK